MYNENMKILISIGNKLQYSPLGWRLATDIIIIHVVPLILYNGIHTYNTPFLLNSRTALHIWKQRCGHEATYRCLIEVFKKAGYDEYSKIVKLSLTGMLLIRAIFLEHALQWMKATITNYMQPEHALFATAHYNYRKR